MNSTRLFTECSNTDADGENKDKGKTQISKHQTKTKKQNECRKKQIKTTSSLREDKEKFIKNLSTKGLTATEIKLLSKGLKFIPTTVVTKNKIRRQLLQDFKHFARRMR